MPPDATPEAHRRKGLPSPLSIDQSLLTEHEEIVKKARHFGRQLANTVKREAPEAVQEIISASIDSTSFLFQKWNLEILYLLAIEGVARFSTLKNALKGISSRTLSTKLKDLEENAIVDRKVYEQRPLRVEYSLTERGLILAGLTTPLVAYLNLEHVTAKLTPRA